VSGLWVLVDVELLLRLTAAAFFVVCLGVCVVAAETANQIYAAGSDADQSVSEDVPSSFGTGRWAAGPGEVSPAPQPAGGPTP
jgi:hypothetical protein